MWLSIKIAMFYGAPVAAVLAALVLAVVLVLRVRSGRLGWRHAGLLYLWAWLAPLAALLLIVLTGELAGYFSSTVTQYQWDGQRVLGLLQGVLPVAAYVAAAVVVLHLLLVLLLAWLSLRAGAVRKA
ncbi:MAG: hypothetical protein K2W84_09825 [Burkholderiales bacterium]|nr:hypothetical protein [Burkholderiales bacterium]